MRNRSLCATMATITRGFSLTQDPVTDEAVLEIEAPGVRLTDMPMFNKGTAFTNEERDLLGLRGLLPPRVTDMQEQVARILENFERKESDLERYIQMMSLLDRNETLFYRVVLDNIEKMLPIIYTPTVGLACQKFGHIYRRSRGLYLTLDDTSRIDDILATWPYEDVRVIVVTDGERILGLGDLGAGGMGIPIGKLALYVVGAGLHPWQTMPVCLDVGTDNAALREDPMYLGQVRGRERGPAYDRLVDAFVSGVQKRFPKALIQFEDFGIKNSFRLLDEYRDRALCFNDDIQGTAAVTLAGILAGLRLSKSTLDTQRVVIAGAGSAGIGIARQIRAASQNVEIWLTNSKGVVTPDVATDFQRPFARAESDTLASLCKRIHPTVLIGVTGQPGLFTREIIESMGGERPLIFPLSNPTASSECHPDDARAWTGGRCLIATGSPFKNTAQCNNVYIFPGVGLGVALSGAKRVTDEHFTRAAHALAAMATDSLFPPLANIREISAVVARAVGAQDPEKRMWDPRYIKYRPARTALV
jgi:malate dehydrogenase (oxaloacetate-decarboxylating)(NADP+)